MSENIIDSMESGVTLPLFREDIPDNERKAMQMWARENYKAHDPVKGVWHPIVQAECAKINSEHGIKITANQDVLAMEVAALDAEDAGDNDPEYQGILKELEDCTDVLAEQGPDSIPYVVASLKQYIAKFEGRTKCAPEDGCCG